MADGKERKSAEQAKLVLQINVCGWTLVGPTLTLRVSHVYECTRQHLHNETSGCTLHPQNLRRKCTPMSQDHR